MESQTIILDLIKANTLQIGALASQISQSRESIVALQVQMENIDKMFWIITTGVVGLVLERAWQIFISFKKK